MLPLHGTAIFSRGVTTIRPSYVVRLRSSLDSFAKSAADFRLVRSKEELQAAACESSRDLMIVSDEGLERLPEATRCARLISVPAKFNYLSDGDVIGFHPQSGRFRTLYRRASAHNSILVTDRCNHYCLMCSQPPKEVDGNYSPLCDGLTRV
jgi:hypothetical protein